MCYGFAAGAPHPHFRVPVTVTSSPTSASAISPKPALSSATAVASPAGRPGSARATRPPPMLLLIAASVILTTSLALSSYGRRLAVDTPIAWLAGFQAFRILVEIFLDWGSHQGLVPPQMTFEGRNWDILTGITAIPVAWLAARGRMPRGGILAWNLLGVGLLLNIVTVAMLSMPTPLQRFTAPNTFITGPPYVWLPVFLVQAAWFGHLLVFRRLAQTTN